MPVLWMIFVLIGPLVQGKTMEVHQSVKQDTLSAGKTMSDQEIVQTLFEGIFFENRLDGPFMVKYCFNA